MSARSSPFLRILKLAGGNVYKTVDVFTIVAWSVSNHHKNYGPATWLSKRETLRGMEGLSSLHPVALMWMKTLAFLIALSIYCIPRTKKFLGLQVIFPSPTNSMVFCFNSEVHWFKNFNLAFYLLSLIGWPFFGRIFIKSPKQCANRLIWINSACNADAKLQPLRFYCHEKLLFV